MKIYKPFLLFLVFIVLSASALYADKIDLKTAKLLAANFYYEKSLLSGYTNKAAPELTLSFTRYNNNEEVYYVFSSENGYIITSADDDVYPVLAYSFEGKFSTKNISPEFSFWMSTYEDQILYIRKNRIKADQNILNAWNLYLYNFDPASCQKGTAKSIEPLLMSTWDQGTYYNSLCPLDPAGQDGHVWSGCVATAMAQVMYYYRYPHQGSGSHGYNSDYGYLFADFGSETYKWDEMQNDIGSNYNYSMALIQLHCGIAIDMNYSPDGSGAFMDDDVYAMKTYFGYSSSTELFRKNDYSTTQWENLLKTNLDNKMPIQYAGYGEGGHAFVCDGYQGTNFFHFNWGWSGSYNGYFYLDNLNPGYTFNYGQQAILNSSPANTYPQYCSGLKTINSSYGSIEDGSGPSINYQNNSDCMWLIAPVDSIDNIKIRFERINTEASNDIITIYDGESTADSVLAIISGNVIPADIISTGKKVLVRFTTNGSTTAEGWLLTFNSEEVKFCNNMTEFTTPAGSFSDGSGNYNYNNSTFCRWRIHPANASSISITFNNIDLADDLDYIKVFDEAATSELYTFYSGAAPQTFTAYTDRVLLLFRTSGAFNGNGWDISYTSESLSVSEQQKGFVNIMPNPASDYIRIQTSVLEASSVNISVYDNMGKLIFTEIAETDNGKLNEIMDIKDLSQGMYFLKLSSEKFNHTQKLIIR